MKFDEINLSVEYWKKKLKKFKGKFKNKYKQTRKEWCNMIIDYVIDIQIALSVRDGFFEQKMEQLNICIEELEKIRDDESYNKYKDIARMWKVVKDIQRGVWNGREWDKLKLMTSGQNTDHYPNLKL